MLNDCQIISHEIASRGIPVNCNLWYAYILHRAGIGCTTKGEGDDR